jgi:hypothetical protein
MSLAPLPIRLFCDIAAPSALADLNRGSQPPSFYRGDDIEIDIGVGQNGALLTSLANVASVTCLLFAAENDTNGPMMTSGVPASAMNLALTQANWTAGGGASGNCHAAFLFPNSQTAISLNGSASVNYWLRVTAQTTETPAKQITLLNGPITVRDGPVSTAAAPPASAATFRYYSVAGQYVPQLLDAATGQWHTLAIYNDGGILTLQLSDQGY